MPRKDSRNTKMKIVNAAWELFYRNGYENTTVEEIVDNVKKIAILDTSAACHMPDVIEMPYRPPLLDSGEAGDH